MTPTPTQSTEPFDLISAPDEDSRHLRDALQSFTLGAALVTGSERTIVSAQALRAMCGDALDLITGLLLLRRALIVLMRASAIEALALPYPDLALASLVPLRVKHDPRALPNLLQLLLPGEGLVTISSSAYNEPPPAFDSNGDGEVQRLRAALVAARQALLSQEGRDTVLALIDVTLRT